MMTNESWLISWIGGADHDSAESISGEELGPIASALKSEKKYDRVYLLTNYDFNRSKNYCAWLEKVTGYDSKSVDLFGVDLSSPINYAEIYEQVCANLRRAGLPNSKIELTFHLSPGTPAMAAIWIMLAKTRFPAKLIQTSRHRGVESVNFHFDLAGDFLPEYIQREDDRFRRLAAANRPSYPEFKKIIHKSKIVSDQIDLARRAAPQDWPILILGETGTGKELFAEAVHVASGKNGPFIAVNCGAISPELASSELFGHTKGAFTGAMKSRAGHFVQARNGTLFLDEVGDLPLETQVRLLRALESKEITPLGESLPIKVTARVVAATNRNLAKDVVAGRFREDLYYRLAMGVLTLPPLRDRQGDIELLIDHFLAAINSDASASVDARPKKLSLEARQLLLAHSWPGNIRELYNTLVRVSMMFSRTETIEAADILSSWPPTADKVEPSDNIRFGDGFKLKNHLDEIARPIIEQALKQASGNKTRAATLLGLASHQTLSDWIVRLEIGR